MVGKARSSNFTEAEKLDLLKLVKPYISVIEAHKHKHSAIVEKNRSWEAIAEKYNAIGGDRPLRTAQGLRTLYKRLKEYAKQELVHQKQFQPAYRQTISEPTRRLIGLVPRFFQTIESKDKTKLHRPEQLQECNEGQPGISSAQVHTSSYKPPCLPTFDIVEMEPEQDEKPPPLLNITSQQNSCEERLEEDLTNCSNRSVSSSLSSVNIRMTLSPSPTPTREGILMSPQVEGGPRQWAGHSRETLEMLKEEHEIIMENQRKLGLYIVEKREGQKRKQQLEEELIRVKIKVEKLKAVRLRHGLPEYNNF
ncbi:fibrinogen silencer-binding protein-like [Latimeria chalumnae]|uniref:Fibrinogen silencer binding protein n=1 Tax=Latimeria chalumnae TaxID=7897 RepID=H3AGT6_LATCH|nr:PREDICTED: fibrinogen silencer-binding protein-like [Latimeria chalumnae]|eukprot:XP_006003497.1 PREDICTED: fibrinogen silencer-binding protein-like [Latimeria chalumnae]